MCVTWLLTKPATWAVEVVCQHYQRVYQATGHKQLLQLALLPQSTCVISQEQPPHTDVINCDPDWYL